MTAALLTLARSVLTDLRCDYRADADACEHMLALDDAALLASLRGTGSTGVTVLGRYSALDVRLPDGDDRLDVLRAAIACLRRGDDAGAAECLADLADGVFVRADVEAPGDDSAEAA